MATQTTEQTQSTHSSSRFRHAVSLNFHDKQADHANAYSLGFTTLDMTLCQLIKHKQAGHATTAPHDGRRAAANVTCVQVFELDFDTEDDRSRLATLAADPFIFHHAAFLYTTASHTEDKPRARVAFVFSEALLPEEARVAVKALLTMYPHADQSTSDVSRIFYGATGCEVLRLDNVLGVEVLRREVIRPYQERLEEERLRREADRAAARARLGTANASSDAYSRYVATAVDAILVEVATAARGERHATLLRASTRLASLAAATWHSGAATEDWQDRLEDAARACGYVQDYGEEDLRRIVEREADDLQPADQPILNSSDFFQPGDFVEVRHGQRVMAHCRVERMRQAAAGDYWEALVGGVWYPRSWLRHDTEDAEAYQAEQPTNSHTSHAGQATGSAAPAMATSGHATPETAVEREFYQDDGVPYVPPAPPSWLEDATPWPALEDAVPAWASETAGAGRGQEDHAAALKSEREARTSRISARPASTTAVATAARTQLRELDDAALDQNILHRYADETNRTTKGEELAKELWPGHETAEVSYFKGEYPKALAHTCKTFLRVKWEEHDPATGHYRRHGAKLWRARRLDNGHTMRACPACQHEVAWRAAQQLEKEAGAYRIADMPFQFVRLQTAAADRLVNTIRQWGKRHEDLDVRYWSRPLTDNTAVIVHNVSEAPVAGDLDPRMASTFETLQGQQLPSDRAELYALFMSWIKSANEANMRHSAGWGKTFRGARGDGRKGTGEEVDMGRTVEIDASWTKAMRAVAAYLDQDKLPSRGKLDIPAWELCDIFDQLDLEYTVVKGEDLLEEWRAKRPESKFVPTSVHNTKNYVPKSVQSPEGPAAQRLLLGLQSAEDIEKRGELAGTVFAGTATKEEKAAYREYVAHMRRKVAQ